jgi:hypothetical protein
MSKPRSLSMIGFKRNSATMSEASSALSTAGAGQARNEGSAGGGRLLATIE